MSNDRKDREKKDRQRPSPRPDEIDVNEDKGRKKRDSVLETVPPPERKRKNK